MDLFRNAATKGYKFLQELDEPSHSHDDAGKGLEASLEGAAERILSWTGSKSQTLGDAPVRGDSEPAPRGTSLPLASPSEPLASPSEPLASPSEPLASPCEPPSAAEPEQAPEVADGPASAPGDEPAGDVASAEAEVAEAGEGCEAPDAADGQAEVSEGATPGASALEYHYIGDDEEDSAVQEPRQADVASPDRHEDGAAGADRSRVDSSGWWSSPGSLEGQGQAQQAQPSEAELAEVRKELLAQVDENEQSVRELGRTRQDAAKVRAELQEARNLLQQREKQLSQLAEALAEKEAVCQGAAQRALAAERRSKQDAHDTEKELLQAQERWREKIAAAERRAQEAQLEAQGKVSAANAERDEALKETGRLRSELGSRAHSEEKTRKDLETGRSNLEAECRRLAQRLRSSEDIELQLRRELTSLEQGRADLEGRCADLTGQLERTQAAYDAAGSEIGAMSTRLHELEFGSKTDTSAQDMLRQELDAAKERCSELEQRAKECAWMRDYALQQAEEARSQLNAQRADMAAPAAADGGDATQHAGDASASDEARKAREEAEELRAEIQRMATKHQEEMRRQAQMSLEEVEYLKRKNDEKDRRLEVLTCERNALRYESADERAKKPAAAPAAARGGLGESLPDLEDPQQPKLRLAEQGSAAGAVSAAFAEGDVVLRRLTRLIYLSPLARRTFYGYIVFLHVWIWVVLHRAAAAHSPHGA